MSSSMANSVRAILPIFAALFLFSGMYKKSLIAPFVDWTAFWGALILATFMAALRPMLMTFLKDKTVWVFFLLILYLTLRLADLQGTHFGHYKLATATIFGSIAMLVGYYVGRDSGALVAFAWATFLAGLAVSALAISQALTFATYSQTNSIGDGGYQLTSRIAGLGCILAVCVMNGSSHKRLITIGVAVSVIGMSYIGSVPAFIFLMVVAASAIAALLLLGRPGIAEPFAAFGIAVALGLAFVLVLSVLHHPPASVARFLWKSDAAVSELVPKPSQPSLSEGTLLAFGVKELPIEERDNYVDRVKIFRYVIQQVPSNPIFGHGFGSFEYKGVRTEHNLLLELIYEGGLIALAIFGAFNLIVLSRIKRISGSMPSSLIGTVGVAVLALCYDFMLEMVGGFFIDRTLMFFYGVVLGLLSVPDVRPREANC